MTRRCTLAAIPLAALILAQCLGSIQAAGSPAPATLVLERLELRFDSVDHASMEGILTLFAYPSNGSSFMPADEVRSALAAPGQEAFRAGVEDYCGRLLCETLRGIIPQDQFTIGRCAFDNSSLTDAPGTDGYHPPLVLRASGELSLGPASFGLPPTANLTALVPLALSDGAHLRRGQRLSALPGYRVEVSLESFPGSIFVESGTGFLDLVIDNSNGTSELSKDLTITLRSPSSRPSGNESARVRGRIDIPDLGNMSVRGTVEFMNVDPRSYWTPPAGLRNMTILSGRTLSELVRSGVVSTGEIYAYGIRPIQLDLQARLGSLFNISLNLLPSWSTEGNLSCTLAGGSAGQTLFPVDAALIKGALNAGAEYCFCVPIELGWPTELELAPPAGTVLKGLDPLGSIPGGRTLYIYRNAGAGSIDASLASSSPAPGSQDIRVEVVTDFSRPGLGLAELVLGQTAKVPVFVDARVMMGTAAVPAGIAAMLPSNLTMAYITADLVRLLLEKKVIGDREMSSVLQEMRPRLDAPMKAALGQRVQPGLRYIQASLHDYDIGRMDGTRPVIVEAWASGTREKHLDLFKTVRASPGLVRISQDFALKGVAGWNVTYRMRFAPELRLASVDGHGARVTRGSDNGRDYFEVSFGKAGGAENVTAFLEPAPGYLASSLGPQLSPCFVLFIVLLVIAFIRLRKRRRRRKASHPPRGHASPAQGPAPPPQQT